jgi:hypothetical protein
MGEEFFKHRGNLAWVDEQLREGAKLGQRLHISFQVCRVNQSGLGREYEGLQFFVERLPVKGEVFHGSKIVLAPAL